MTPSASPRWSPARACVALDFAPGLVALDVALVWLWLRAVARFHLDLAPSATLLAWWALAFAIAASCLGLHRLRRARAERATILRVAGLVFGCATLVHVARPELSLLLLAWTAGAIGLSMALARRVLATFRADADFAEGARWAALILLVAWAYDPFFQPGGIGSGDAHWYASMLADFLTQLRAGVFPIWSGQSEFAFNGAVSPWRFAPWFQAAGGALDLVTARILSPLEIRNAVIVGHALAGALTCYLSLSRIIPHRGNLALLLAALYATCPGYLAPLFVGDLFMTFMTMPFLPLVWLGVLDPQHQPRRADAVVAVALAGLWLAHAPIAMWTTLAAIVAWLGLQPWPLRPRETVLRAARVAGLGFVLGAFPFASIAALDNQFSATLYGIHAYEQVARWFPANFLPADISADRLTLYQIGYGCLACALIATLLWTTRRERATGLLLLITLAFFSLVVPVPWFTEAVWRTMPSFVISINNVWPTQRLFAITAVLAIFALAWQLARTAWCGRLAVRVALGALLLAALGWSIHEARKYRAFGEAGRVSREIALPQVDARNAILTRYAYSAFAEVPAYVSHGHMDPRLENRLWNADGATLLAANAEVAAPRTTAGPPLPHLLASSVLITEQNSGIIWPLAPRITLPPRADVAVRFDFARPEAKAILRIRVGRLQRDYILPDSGSGLNTPRPPRAFGATPTSARVIGVQNLEDRPHELEISLVALDDIWTPAQTFGRVWVYSLEAAQLPVTVHSLLPYHATVEAAQPVLLETPRVWMSRYRATVDGTPVPAVRSAEGLVAVPVPGGRHEVKLWLSAPWWLHAVFWAALVGWSAVAGCVLRTLWRQPPTAP